MKRRLLSAFLAVMMVLTMAPVAFAADTSVDSYDSLVEAINSASDGDTITLNGDIDVQQTLVVTQDLTLDLAGHKLYNTNDLWDDQDNNWSLISVRENGDLTITGNGTLDAKKDDCYAVDVQDENAKATLENGTFVGNITTVYVFEGTLVVKDGSYSIKQLNSNGVQSQYGLTINCYDQNYKNGTAKVLITGGTFAHFNPVDNAAEGTGTNFATSGYETVEGTDGLYTAQVKSDNAAAIDDVQYATLADAVAAAKDGGTIELLKDVEETLRLKQGEDITLNLNGHTLSAEQTTVGVVHGKLVVNGPGTIKENKPNFGAIIAYGSVSQNDTNYTEVTVNKDVTLEGWAPVFIDQKNGKAYGVSVNLNGVTLNAKNDTSNAVGSGVYVNGQITDAVNSPVINLDSTTIASTGHGMYLAGYATTTVNGGSVSGSETGIEIRAGKLTVNGATVNGNGIPTSVTPNGNGSTSAGAGIAVAQHTTKLPIDVTISDGMISGYTGLLESNPQNNPEAAIARVNINVTGGKFAAINGGKNAVSSDDKRVIISGGVFAQKFDNSYCATGMTVIDSKDTTYPWTVGTVKVQDENEIKTDTQKGATQATLSSEIAKTDETAATAVGASVTPTKLTDTTPITADDKAQALTELVKNKKVKLTDDGKIPAGTTVTVVKETYLDVTVTAYDAKSNTVSMDITPKYNLIAVAKTGTNEEKVTLESAQDAKVGSTEVEVTLPEAFKGNKVYINHNNGANLYVATADKTTGKVKFTTNGFSPFTFALTNPDVVAEVNGNAYKSLQDAANAAKDGGEITVVQNKNLDLTFNTTKSVKVTNKTDGKITVKFNGTNKDVAKNATETFSYTKPSSSGGSSSGKTTYKVTTSAVNNGGVNASPSNAEKGATITITLSPNKGYKLDKLTVTDGSGKSVSTVKKSDTVYTFTMPASAVTVGVSYAKADETPSKTTFNDVSANDWFASAVDYVTGKGMMNGTAANTFSPKANTTRGMLMTVLARHAGEDTTGGSVWYEKGMNWAKANGVSDGTNPQVNITREQLAAMLYRYAQNKKYDVSGAKSLDGYTDAQSVSSYAVPALQWANAAGVVNGKSGSKLDPKGYATRAEVAAMLMRFCENVEK